MLVRSFLGLIMISCLVAHAHAADWGMNGTIAVTNATLFPLTTQPEAGTYVRATKPILDQNIWVLSYYVPTAPVAERNRVKLWQIVLGDNPANTIATRCLVTVVDGVGRCVAEASTSSLLPPSTRGMTALGFTAPDSDGTNYANAISVGGVAVNGVLSAKATNSYVAIAGGGVSFVADATFPNMPSARAGAIVDEDVTAPRIVDANAVANASLYIFGGEVSSGVTNEMLRLHSTGPIPDGWDVITPLGPNVPAARADHAGLAIGSKWYMYGGQNDSHIFGDTWVFDFPSLNWTLLNDFGTVPRTDAAEAYATDVDGQSLPKVPPARYGHAMAKMVGTNNLGSPTELIIIAGGTNNHTYFNDLWAFDPISTFWEPLSLPEPKYAPRAFAALMAHHNESYVFLYGGHDETTAFSDVWTFDMAVPLPQGPGFKALPNNVIAGVAGGILLVLIITVVVLKVTDRNNS